MKNHKIVFTNGCFDVLHIGHLHTLCHARALGNVLIVAVNSDSSVRRLKGASRPIHTEYNRMLLLASMTCVDLVILFDEDTPYDLIKKIHPDVLVKGGDYKEDEVVGYDIAIKTVIIPYLPGHSSSTIIAKLD